jgi:hypothetical protein
MTFSEAVKLVGFSLVIQGLNGLLIIAFPTYTTLLWSSATLICGLIVIIIPIYSEENNTENLEETYDNQTTERYKFRE